MYSGENDACDVTRTYDLWNTSPISWQSFGLVFQSWQSTEYITPTQKSHDYY